MKDEDLEDTLEQTLILKPKNKTLKITKIELMGGEKSDFENYLNVDMQAKEGFRGSVAEFDQLIEPGTIEEVIISNPYLIDYRLEELLALLKKWLSSSGRVIINGTPNNKFFNKLKNPEKLKELGFEFNGLPMQPLQEKFRNYKYYKSDLISEINIEKMKTTILKNTKLKGKDSWP